MTLYGATSILQVLPECKRDEDQTRTASGSLGKLLRPKAWTSARAWRPAAAPRFNFDSRDEWNAHNYTVWKSAALLIVGMLTSGRRRIRFALGLSNLAPAYVMRYGRFTEEHSCTTDTSRSHKLNRIGSRDVPPNGSRGTRCTRPLKAR